MITQPLYHNTFSTIGTLGCMSQHYSEVKPQNKSIEGGQESRSNFSSIPLCKVKPKQREGSTLSVLLALGVFCISSYFTLKFTGDYYAKRVVEEQNKAKQATPPSPKKKSTMA